MEAFLTASGVVALAEIGDKTQLLALLLAARFRRPWPIVLGILVATVLNHALAAAVGAWVTSWVSPSALRWILGLSFLAMAVWILIPDKLDDDEEDAFHTRFGVFGATIVAFFLAEMGDKTQVATVFFAARFHDLWSVVLGTTVGMMLANVPVVFLGDAAAKKLPLRWVHGTAALVFAVLGVVVLVLG